MKANKLLLQLVVISLLSACVGTVPITTPAPLPSTSPTPLTTTSPTQSPIIPAPTLPSQLVESQLELVWSSTGEPDSFSAPDGIGLDQQGNLYVADAGNSRVQKLDSQGNLITKWGSKGKQDGQFNCWPCGLAVDGQGNVYVTDTNNARVQKFDSNGKFLAKWGSPGTEDGQFNRPFGVAVDRQGNVYVGDVANARIQKFDSDGNFLAKWGSRGDEAGQFSSDLADIAIDPQGNVYVTDRSNGLQKFDSNGNFLEKWETCGDDKLMSAATGVAVPGTLATVRVWFLFCRRAATTSVCPLPATKWM